ncbi:MAG: adenylosuccinate lyase [Candidatus Gastranaerophilales bacterium]|nr:adenylosuccinate lyase [Candidatus Gastranaerophilales bacterium]
MIDRYSRPEIKEIWDLNTKFDYYLKVELAVCEAYAELGIFPESVIPKLKKKAKFSIDRIDKIEAEVHHDVIAFLTNVNENLGKDLSQYMHVGMTSSDVIDTAFALQIADSGKIISKEFEKLLDTIKNLAIKHKNTVCIGRSHGIHAEVTTFGIKLLNIYDILERAYNNLQQAQEDIRVGQISGPVGTYSNIPIELEPIACKNLGLKPARISTQIIARDYHAKYMQALGLIASIIEQIATEIRHLQRTEVREVEEGFAKKQKGSSAMPHKKNPVLSENLSGLARVVRNNVNTAMENIVLWHERDISHSSAERIIFPDSLILIDFMLSRLNSVMQNLVIKEENMKKNTNLFGGIVYSQRVMLALVDKGLTRENAYTIVQRNALNAFENDGDFRYNLEHDDEVYEYLSTDEIDDCFQQADYLRNVDKIFEKFNF